MLAGAGQASAAPRSSAPPPQPADVASVEQRLRSLAANAALVRELNGMGGLDQEMRLTLLQPRASASGADRERLSALYAPYIGATDQAHVARLKAMLQGRGWFRLSEVGSRAADAAFLIVQHSGDLTFMRSVLATMEPLLAEHEVDGQEYALLYDRVATMEHRPQRYGSQGTTCGANGEFVVPADLDDPAGVDQRRAAVGMQPMAEYLAGLGRMYGRCTPPAPTR